MDFGKYGNCLEGRLYAIRKDQKLNQGDFGKRLGVTRSAICNYEGGTRPIGEQIILAVCREFSVDELWMRHGIGVPYKSKNGIIEQLISEFHCTKFEGDFLKVYFQMDETERMSFIKCAFRLLSPFMSGLKGKNPFADYFDVTYGVDHPGVVDSPHNGSKISKSPQEMTNRELHAELDRQLIDEKNPAEESEASGLGNSGTGTG